MATAQMSSKLMMALNVASWDMNGTIFEGGIVVYFKTRKWVNTILNSVSMFCSTFRLC